MREIGEVKGSVGVYVCGKPRVKKRMREEGGRVRIGVSEGLWGPMRPHRRECLEGEGVSNWYFLDTVEGD